jgi:hypothetical protein
VANKCAAAKQAGEACASTDECGVSLTCDPTSQTCKAPTYAEPGAPCGGTSGISCRVGSCNQAGVSSGTCPSIIPDGQPCTQPMQATTCDDGAYCINGKCSIFDPGVSCK